MPPTTSSALRRVIAVAEWPGPSGEVCSSLIAYGARKPAAFMISRWFCSSLAM
jgi:hypothetical protein